MNYNDEFLEDIEGLNYDDFDKNSIILINKKDSGEISGSIRIILDKNKRLQSEKEIDLSKIRKKGNIAEFSRQVILPKYQGNGNDFKKFYSNSYKIAKEENIQIYIAGFLKSHLKLYEKFGGIEVLKEFKNYGNIKNDCIIASWDIRNISPFFKKIFLNEVKN